MNRKIVLATICCILSIEIVAQEVKGKVITSEDGQGLPGVTIQVKGSDQGRVTDVDGNYSLVANPNDTLIFSFVGFKSQAIAVGASSVVNVTLVEDVKRLSELVVIGYGVQKRSDITGSVVSIDNKDLNPGPVVSVSNLLQNTAPGVVLTQSSAQPGGGFDVKIRGASSVLGDQGPLYVVDGVPIINSSFSPSSGSRYRSAPDRNPLNGINPMDIESMEILKDASATAIYGARGANGVILITTKRGDAGKLSLDYSTSFSLQQLANEYDMLSASEFARISNEIFLQANPSSNPPFSAALVNTAGEGTNWIDEITRIGTIQQHQLGANGGKNGLRYYVSGNYYQHNGIVEVSALRRYGGRVNIDYKRGRWLLNTSVLASRVKDTQIPFGGSGGPEFAGLFNNTRLWSPLVPVRQDDGVFSLHPSRPEIPNPVSLLEIEDIIMTDRLLTSFSAEYEVVKGLKAKLRLGLDRSKSGREAFIPLTVIRGAQANGEGESGKNNTRNVLAEYTMSYVKDIANKHAINVLAGYTFQQFDSDGSNVLFTDFADQTTNFEEITKADTLFDQPFKERSRLLSYLARFNYSFNDRYLVTMSFRADGSTKFGPQNKWGYFPSAALAWKIHNEKFFNSGLFEELKLRVSYGQIGNQEIGNKRSQSLYNLTRRTVLGLDGIPIQGWAAIRPDNPDLKWETSTQFNVGVDFSILEGRIYGSIDAYRKFTSDLLLEFDLPGTAGFDAVTTNTGSLLNRGIELALASKNLVGELKWTTSFNLAYNKNSWDDRAGFYPEGAEIAIENGPIGGIYGYVVEGIFQSQPEIDNSPDQSAVAIPQPGTFKYSDLDDDGKITPADRTLLGKADPDYTIGLNNIFEYGNFDLSFFFQGAFGREKENFTRAYLEDGDDLLEGFNKSTEINNRWGNSSSTLVPGLDGMIGGVANNSVYIEDASFVRLRNVTLGYECLPTKWIKKLRIYADAQNLLTLTRFKGTDPETDEGTQYPNSRTYTLGLNVTF